MKLIRQFVQVISIGLAAGLSACGGGSSGGPEPDTPLPTTLAVVGPARVDTGTALQWRSSVAVDAHGLSFEWRFGDGTTSTAAAPTHGYAQPGVYELELSVRDHTGAVVSARRQVRVGAFPMVAGLQCSGANESGWCWQMPLPNGHAGLDVTFVDAREGWMVGDGGLALHTADGGQSWTPQAVPTFTRLLRVSFGDARHGWIAAADGTTWVTQDGGANWRAGGALGLERIDRTWSRGPNLAFATGALAHDPYRTTGSTYSTDGGLTWRATPDGFVIDQVDTDGTVWSATWHSATGTRPATATTTPWRLGPLPAGIPPDKHLDALEITDSGFAWARTSNTVAIRPGAGQAWTAFTPLTPPAAELAFTPSGVTLSPDGQALMRAIEFYQHTTRWARSADFGRTWSWIDSWPAGWSVRNDLSFADGRTVWGEFTDGTNRGLWFSVDAGLTWRRLFPQLSHVDDCCGWLPVSSFQRGRDGALLVHVNDPTFPGWFRSTDDGATWTPLPGAGGRPAVAQTWAGSAGRLFAAVGDVIHDSSDQGRHWTARRSSAPGASSAFNRQDGSGWTTDGTDLLTTTDAWQTWSRVPLPARDAYGMASWYPQRVLYAEGRRIRLLVEYPCPRPGMCSLTIVASEDGGQSWTAAKWWRDRETFAFASADVAIATDGIHWLRSTDAGNTWMSIAPPAAAVSMHRIRFLDADHGWILGTGNTVWRTTDGGVSWRELRLPVAPEADRDSGPQLNDVAFGDAMHGWIVGNGGLVLATEDGGEHWQVQVSGTSLNLTTVIASGKTTAWIGGEQGAILATVSGGRVDP
ncbi:MAG: YCF48-related protein [Aquabacterium sp.]|nr:YCF48-related protein [Aquabacterium sp.]